MFIKYEIRLHITTAHGDKISLLNEVIKPFNVSAFWGGAVLYTNLLYGESDLSDVGLVVQKLRKQGGTVHGV